MSINKNIEKYLLVEPTSNTIAMNENGLILEEEKNNRSNNLKRLLCKGKTEKYCTLVTDYCCYNFIF